MTEITLRHALRHFVHELGAAEPIDDDTDLFATGTVKSMQLMELVNHLEDAYGVRVEQRDLLGGALRSLTSIASFVLARRSAP
jgi:acyl carrier protein